MSDASEPNAPPAPPPPTVVQASAAVVVIGGCLFTASLLLVAYQIDGNPFNFIAIPFVWPFCAFLGYKQYRSTFQGHARAARQAMFTCYGLAAFFTFGYAANVGEYFQEGGRRLTIVWDMSFILVPALVGLVLGFVNHRRSRVLRVWFEQHPDAKPRRTVTLRELLIGFGLIGVVVALGGFWIRSAPPRDAEHVTREAARLTLPENATDVSYHRGMRGVWIFEFTTDEASFRRWVAETVVKNDDRGTERPLQEIAGEQRVSRYHRDWNRDAVIIDGLFYQWSFEDMGRHAAFDRRTGRAYYYAHSH